MQYQYVNEAALSRYGMADQGRHAVLMPQLGQGEHGALLHLELHARVVHQLGEPARRGLAGRLTEPEDGRAPGLARQRTRTGETQQVGPDGDAVRQDGRENGVVAGVAGSARGEVEQIAGGDRGRDGSEIGDSGVEGKAHVAVRRRSDPVGQGALKGEGERQDRRSDHWLMISSSTCAARGSCDWPGQKIAFLRSSLSCSVLAIWIRRSTAAASWRCEYTKMSCSFISRFCIRSYRPESCVRSPPV